MYLNFCTGIKQSAITGINGMFIEEKPDVFKAEIILRHWQYTHNEHGSEPESTPGRPKLPCTKSGLVEALTSIGRHDLVTIVNSVPENQSKDHYESIGALASAPGSTNKNYLQDCVNYSQEDYVMRQLSESQVDCVNDSLEDLVNSSLEEPVNYSLEDPVNRSLEDLVNSSLGDLVNYSLGDRVNCIVEDPVNSSLEDPVNHSLEDPVNHGLEEPVNYSLGDEIMRQLSENQQDCSVNNSQEECDVGE